MELLSLNTIHTFLSAQILTNVPTLNLNHFNMAEAMG
jgi:hypothetical protein